ncbi:MAG: VWA domain-containing protein [Acidobacteria bacterium]|nr:VWA domain-containing protein [Acidobacteriota bacterium]
MKYELACLVFAWLLAGISSGSPVRQKMQTDNEQDRIFRIKTELVEVRAVVRDRKGHIVENLKKEDFELLENNQQQEISHFSVLQVEGTQDKSAASMAPSPQPGSRPGNLRERLNAPPARSIILYVDNLHLEFQHLNWVKQSLRRIIDEQMTDQGMMAIVTSDGTLGIAQQFTRDRRILRYAVDRIRIGPNAWETERFTATLAGRIQRGDPKALEEGKAIVYEEEHIEDKYGSWTRARANRILFGLSYFRETMLLSLKALIEQLAGMPGQRMIALFSGGLTQNGRDGFPKYDEARAVINRASRSGVVIYSIDGRGLLAGTPDQEKLDILAALAKDTGGEFYMNDNNLSGLLGRAFESNRFYYVLGYYLRPGNKERKFHGIKVRLPNHPEYKVRTIRGFSPSDIKKAMEDEGETTPQQRLIQSINKPLPVTGLNVTAKLDFLEAVNNSPQVSLTVHFEGGNLQYRQQDQNHAFTVEILYAIYDSYGRQVETASANVRGILTPERLAQGQTNGFVFSKQLTLKPGVYQARVGVREMETDRIGTATAWIEAPDLERSKLALSSLILLDPMPAGRTAADDANAGGLKQIKTVQGIRIYPRDEFCGYVFRVFRNINTPIGADLALKTELLKDGKPIKQKEWLSLIKEQKDKDDKGNIYVGGKVNLAGLAPGIYELNVSVKDARSKKTAHRTAVFGIE